MNKHDDARRREYAGVPLRREGLPASGLAAMVAWYAAAQAAYAPSAGSESSHAAASEHRVLGNECVLATTDAQGQPDARVVLAREVSEAGVVFYTDLSSSKGAALAASPAAGLLFWWPRLDRQLRIRGITEVLDAVRSDAYFNNRPRGSQLSAAVSHQSKPVEAREVLEAARERLATSLGDAPVGRPERWGGYRLVPHAIELWQGRPDRFHDRFLYTREGEGWSLTRLQP